MSALLSRLDELLAGAAPSALDADLRRVVQAHEARSAGLSLANARSRAHPPVQDAVRRAIARHLRPEIRAALAEDKWLSSLLEWLDRAHRAVGLDHPPSRRTVEKAFRKWRQEKPYGDSSKVRDTRSDNGGVRA